MCIFQENQLQFPFKTKANNKIETHCLHVLYSEGAVGLWPSIQAAPFMSNQHSINTKERLQGTINTNVIANNLHYMTDSSYSLSELTAAETGRFQAVNPGSTAHSGSFVHDEMSRGQIVTHGLKP